MKKLLIIDDDFLVRLGIAQSIDWSDYGIQICGEAENGIEGLELAAQLKPDIIICDMKMPHMNGVEFVKNLDKNISCAVIILSGFDDYEFVKESFENGVYSYLLKPIDNKKLIDAALDALKKLEEKRAHQKYIKQLESSIPDLRQKFLFSVANSTLTDLDKIKSDAALFNIDISGGLALYIKADEGGADETVRLYNTVKQVLNAQRIGYTAEHSQNAVIALIKNSSAQELKYIAEKMSMLFESGGNTFSCGISESYKDEEGFKDALTLAYRNSGIKLFPIISSYVIGNEARDIKPIIKEAMKYVSLNYHQELTVKTVSDNLYVSPSHLMHMFKEEVNKTFNECLTDFRILLAKKMLRENKYKIYEISEMIGYTDVKYFSQIFKKRVGKTPTEYMSMI